MKEPDHTAVRVSLWRALHLIVDEKPYIFQDNIGLKLISPNDDWQKRPDMDVTNTSAFRASIVARSRFVDDLVVEQCEKGVDQYVILGAGLDTFAQRHQELCPQLTIYEIDQVDTQLWKKRRLEETGYPIPDCLKFVSVNFEEKQGWLDQLKKKGFDDTKPAVVVSTGVTQYLTIDAIMETLKMFSKLAKGSKLALTFLLPFEKIKKQDERKEVDEAEKGAKAGGTPFISFFTPSEMLALAREAGLKDVTHLSSIDLKEKYFRERTDQLMLQSGEDFIVATI
ncbi:class I SAM-dependent methyltransferase [Cytobacillus kochii]|uniref:class I SAM-dependent methyltransferase n=1 Tax=Cytobacillus kochii TaxID=859143 RepID=UPI00203CBFCE|nr:class I SAM-dependent methyltransferase [Cytobacillus kochii]MCM3323618.1 class I SAM-dependent methyltransferase [Cytobacillus kochii]MCM3346201.1 class I SAM-dependent methyltransferase [Cytobacillus kochii]